MPAALPRRGGGSVLNVVGAPGEDDAIATELPDLDSRAAIHDLVVRFYREIVFDEELEPVFSDVAEVDWAIHLPKLTDYWCRVLLAEPGYDGFILAAHQHVHDIEPLTRELFDRWYTLWSQTIDSGWSGPMAENAKRHAARIGAVLARRIAGTEWVAPLGSSARST